MADTSSDRLYAQLNEDLLPPVVMSPTTVALGTPETATGSDYNTTMVLTGIPSTIQGQQGYSGPGTIFYTRISLSVLQDVVLHSQTGFTLEGIVDQLNSSLATFLTVDDFEPVTIPQPATGETATVTLTATSDSVGWLDSVTVTLSNDKTQLSAVIGVRALTVLTDPAKPLLPGWLISSDFDFTSMRDSLKLDTDTNTYTDFGTLFGVLQQLGFPSFSAGTITDNATSAVPNANQNYDRVVVQATVNSPVLTGPLYFHYNTTKFDGVA